MRFAIEVLIAMALFIGGSLIIHELEQSSKINRLEQLFGMSYQKIMTEVEVCKLLVDEDTECHLEIKPIEVGERQTMQVNSRRDRFCKAQGMDEVVPTTKILLESTR